MTTANTTPDPLLVVFIHGFKGTDETFGEFPKRLHHVLSETVDNVQVECIVFPAYETKGELNAAVTRFADWLTTLTVQRENEHGGGAGSAKIVLCGHSMGGFLAADSLLEFMKTRPDHGAPLWPKIVACITFDTPFLGINPSVVKNGVTKAAEYANTATTVGSAIFGSFAGLGAKKATETRVAPSNASTPTPAWGKWAPAAFAVGGALLAGAAAGGAYYKRDDLNQGYSWLMDHMKYAGNVWDESTLRSRVDALVSAQENDGILFQNFYVHLPEAPPTHLIPRTFIVQPKRTSREWKHFTAARNGQAADEVQGHTSMFKPKMNDGYYNLGLDTAKVIRQALHLIRTAKPALEAVPGDKGNTEK
ncbi:hypothetical protein P691DRAFT_771759 [Macrolepiota fuliginosa MF-IS2]|uniref:DUF676 domain-containing protein n=1 Tax=Macrolepiota fuliginosa MF-IS2 TaxID=1400762 RepID=A0A9P5XNP8_9AGAR|nr:hypothetical protein P691DRAFT_771759 [Macrolepiota fuliginosa MF-IS2]